MTDATTSSRVRFSPSTLTRQQLPTHTTTEQSLLGKRQTQRSTPLHASRRCPTAAALPAQPTPLKPLEAPHTRDRMGLAIVVTSPSTLLLFGCAPTCSLPRRLQATTTTNQRAGIPSRCRRFEAFARPVYTLAPAVDGRSLAKRLRAT